MKYNRRDIEEVIRVPGRDQLIVDTYLEHVQNRKAVVFCVNVRHGEELASRFRDHKVLAKSISGRMSSKERKATLDEFAEGTVRVLCACDLLNEGWDCPDVEVLFMARPTLSKVIYLQQLGRGTRKAPGKESLIVFDLVDNATKYNASLSLHRILGNNKYRKGGLILGSAEAMKAEQDALDRGIIPTQTLPVSLWATDYREIDVFNWQDAIKGMISSSEMEFELATTEGKIRDAVKRETVHPDHELILGSRSYFYFRSERIEEIRVKLDLPQIDDKTIRSRFFEFVEQMDMAASYKPVMLLAIIELVDEKGRVNVEVLARKFLEFYLSRLQGNLLVEQPQARMANPDRLTWQEARDVMLSMPFKKFAQRKFLLYDKQNLADIRFASALWQQLKDEDRSTIKMICQSKIEAYYQRF